MGTLFLSLWMQHQFICWYLQTLTGHFFRNTILTLDGDTSFPALILHGVDDKVLKTFHWNSGLCWLEYITQSLQICQLHIFMLCISHSTTYHKVRCWLLFWWLVSNDTQIFSIHYSWLVLMGPMWAKKTFPTVKPHQQLKLDTAWYLWSMD